MDYLHFIVTFALAPLVIFLIIKLWAHNSRIGRCVDGIPGPKGLPVIGNLLDFSVSNDKVFNKLRKLGNEFYPTYKYWIFHRPTVNIRHPDDIQVILSSYTNVEKTDQASTLESWLKEALLISKGKKWQTRRKMLNHAFSYNLLEGFVETFSEQTAKLVTSLKAETSGQVGGVVKEISTIFSRLSLTIICETSMGLILNDHDRDKYLDAIHIIVDALQYRFTKPWLANNWIFSFTEKGKQQEEAIKTVHKFSSEMIKAKKEHHRMNGWTSLNGVGKVKEERESGGSDVDDGTGHREKPALLDLLLATWKTSGIDDAGIQEEVDVFVAAGYDTTSTSLSFTTLLLAEHKDYQEKCRQEINEVLNGLPLHKITMKEIRRMSYLQQCIKEAMRLYGPTPVIGRKLSEDVQLKSHFLPRGTEVAIQIFDTHRDPKFWPEPNIYNPDRFSPEACKGRHPYSYLPFSLGPRDCIGKKFAMLEVKVIMACLISTFYLEPVDVMGDVRFVVDIILRSQGPVHVKLVPIVK